MLIPATMAVGAWTGVKLVRSGDMALGLDAALAASLSFVAALAALAVLMRMLRSFSLTPFVIYRLILGAVLMWIAYA
jgi:undecaprenyl-diphosphatase